MIGKVTLAVQAQALGNGSMRARDLAEAALDRISLQKQSGIPAFIHVDSARVMAEADAADRRRREGRALSPHDGIPLGVKDLFDVAGEVTTAGSAVLKSAPAAQDDAKALARLRAQGFVVLGRTNMTEFAYSGVGLNPHYGTPSSVYRAEGLRIPGGSSSGSGVAVGEGIVALALGTDTGGSCRIPAAFNGIVGFKPSANRVSRDGVYPLSKSFDSIGPLAASVECCITADRIMSGDSLPPETVPDLQGLKLGVLTSYVLDGLDTKVKQDFSKACDALRHAGCAVTEIAFPELTGMPDLLRFGGIVAHEAWAVHKSLIEAQEAAYDPRVSSRIRLGSQVSAEDYAALLKRRAELIAGFKAIAAGFDALICPTVAVVPPLISALAAEDDYRQINGLCLRNTYVFNFLDGCAISLPMHEPGTDPTGLMLALPAGQDRALLATAAAVERVCSV